MSAREAVPGSPLSDAFQGAQETLDQVNASFSGLQEDVANAVSLRLKVNLHLRRKNVLVVTRKNTNERIVRTRTKFAASAKLRDTSKVLAGKRKQKTRTAQLTTLKKNVKMLK